MHAKEYLALAAQCEWKENVLDISEEDAIAAAAEEERAGAAAGRAHRVPLREAVYDQEGAPILHHELAVARDAVAGRRASYLTAAGAALALARFPWPAGVRAMVARHALEPEPMTAAEAHSIEAGGTRCA